MSPYEIGILLYYYSMDEMFNNLFLSDMNSVVSENVHQKFLKHGLIKNTPVGSSRPYVGNHEALRVYMEALGKVPLPATKLFSDV